MSKKSNDPTPSPYSIDCSGATNINQKLLIPICSCHPGQRNIDQRQGSVTFGRCLTCRRIGWDESRAD